MQTKRADAAKALKNLAKKLTKNQVVSSDRKPEDDLGKTCPFANTDLSKSWLSEINEWIEAINSKVGKRFILS